MIEFYVSPEGNDRWSGKKPHRSGNDGPFATLARAQAAIRRLRASRDLKEPVSVFLRGGTYPLQRPCTFAPKDSGSPARPTKDPKNPWAATEPCPIAYVAFKKEKPVLSGGQRITGFRKISLGGKTVWVATVPDVKAGRWHFRELWVNGRRAQKPVRPRSGFYKVEKPSGEPLGSWAWGGGHKAFHCMSGDIQSWTNIHDVEVVVYNYWIDSHMRIVRFDPSERLVEMDRHAKTHLVNEWGKEGASYRVEGALEHLERAGDWCLDSAKGRVYYLPRAGERIDTAVVVAPRLQDLVRIEGEDTTHPVELLRFEGISFEHSEWIAPADYSGSNQAANDVPGGVILKHARNVSFERCSFTHIGSYGIECQTGCFDVRIVGCDIADLAGGGVKVWHGNTRITISDNEIAHGGRIHGQACGVLVGQSSGVLILHNHIHDFHYTGISVGWRWGYAEGSAYGNVVEYNHVHDLGHGLLSDMGGIYTLGPQPGSRIRYNSFHDVESRTYGGWGIYTDEGSSDILIENNVAYNTKCGGFHQHYGKDNIVRNNIFAWSQENQLARSRLEPHSSFTFEKNISLIDQGLFWKGNWSDTHALLHRNIYWDTRFKSGKPDANTLSLAGEGDGKISLGKWRAMGLDAESLVADPLFKDAKRADFRLRPGSPAFKIGFVPFDLSEIGPRPEMREMRTK